MAKFEQFDRIIVGDRERPVVSRADTKLNWARRLGYTVVDHGEFGPTITAVPADDTADA